MRLTKVLFLSVAACWVSTAAVPRSAADDDEDAQVIKAMLARFDSPQVDGPARRKLLDAIGGFGTKAKDAVPRVVKFLEEQLAARPKGQRFLAYQTGDNVLTTVNTLGKIGPPALPGAKALLTILKDIDGRLDESGAQYQRPHYRQAAAVALGRIGAKEALIELRVSAAGDTDEAVRKAAADAIKAIQAAPAVEVPPKGEAKESRTVTGKVVYKGAPLPGGTITFTPTGGGKAASGKIEADGTYSVPNVQIGSTKILIDVPKGSLKGFDQASGVSLTMEIKARSGPLTLTIGDPPAKTAGAPGTVTGVVTYKGKPLTGGIVAFFPVKGKTVVKAAIDAEGKFKAEGVPMGLVRIAVDTSALRGRPGYVPIPLTFASPLTSGLQLNVGKETESFNINLQ